MAESTVTKKLGPNPTRKEILANWTPEDPVFWKKFGEKIAKQMHLYVASNNNFKLYTFESDAKIY